MLDNEAIFEWSSYPLKDNPQKGIVFLSILILTVALAETAFGHWVWGIFTALFLFLSLHRFTLPTRYRVSAEELEISQLGFKNVRKLSGFQKAIFERNGIFLSPFSVANRLENYRGMFLPYPPESQGLVDFFKQKFEGK